MECGLRNHISNIYQELSISLWLVGHLLYKLSCQSRGIIYPNPRVCLFINTLDAVYDVITFVLDNFSYVVALLSPAYFLVAPHSNTSNLNSVPLTRRERVKKSR